MEEVEGSGFAINSNYRQNDVYEKRIQDFLEAAGPRDWLYLA